jgi:hypothetical protein
VTEEIFEVDGLRVQLDVDESDGSMTIVLKGPAGLVGLSLRQARLLSAVGLPTAIDRALTLETRQ